MTSDSPEVLAERRMDFGATKASDLDLSALSTLSKLLSSRFGMSDLEKYTRVFKVINILIG